MEKYHSEIDDLEEADFLPESEYDTLPESVKDSMEAFVEGKTNAQRKAGKDRLIMLSEFLDSEKCRYPGSDRLNKTKIADALYRVFVLRDLPEGNSCVWNEQETVPEEAEVFSEAVTSFLMYMRYDSSSPLSHYAIDSINQNAYRIRNRIYAEKATRGGVSKATLKAISKKKRELMKQIKGQPLDVQRKMLEAFDKEHYITVQDYEYTECGDPTPYARQDVKTEDNSESLFYLHEYFVKATEHMLSVIKQLKSSSNPLMFPMWYAENVVRIAKTFDFAPDKNAKVQNVADMAYVSFFLQAPCNRIELICKTPYRMERELFEDAEPGVRLAPKSNGWLEAKVPMKYLNGPNSPGEGKKFDDTKISNSRKEFLRKIAEIKLGFFGDNK